MVKIFLIGYLIYLLMQITSSYAQEQYEPLLFAEQMEYFKHQSQNSQNKVEQLVEQEQETELNQNTSVNVNSETNNALNSAQSYKNLLEDGVTQGRQLRNFYESTNNTASPAQKSMPMMILPLEEYDN